MKKKEVIAKLKEYGVLESDIAEMSWPEMRSTLKELESDNVVKVEPIEEPETVSEYFEQPEEEPVIEEPVIVEESAVIPIDSRYIVAEKRCLDLLNDGFQLVIKCEKRNLKVESVADLGKKDIVNYMDRYGCYQILASKPVQNGYKQEIFNV